MLQSYPTKSCLLGLPPGPYGAASFGYLFGDGGDGGPGLLKLLAAVHLIVLQPRAAQQAAAMFFTLRGRSGAGC